MCLVDDAFALADTKLAPASLPLRIVSAVAPRANYPVWITAIGHLRSWSRLLAGAPPPNAIHTMVARIMPQVVCVSRSALFFLHGRDLTAFYSLRGHLFCLALHSLHHPWPPPVSTASHLHLLHSLLIAPPHIAVMQPTDFKPPSCFLQSNRVFLLQSAVALMLLRAHTRFPHTEASCLKALASSQQMFDQPHCRLV